MRAILIIRRGRSSRVARFPPSRIRFRARARTSSVISLPQSASRVTAVFEPADIEYLFVSSELPHGECGAIRADLPVYVCPAGLSRRVAEIAKWRKYKKDKCFIRCQVGTKAEANSSVVARLIQRARSAARPLERSPMPLKKQDCREIASSFRENADLT